MHAWRLPKATYLSPLRVRLTRYLATLNAPGPTTPVLVPNVDKDSSVVVLVRTAPT